MSQRKVRKEFDAKDAKSPFRRPALRSYNSALRTFPLFHSSTFQPSQHTSEKSEDDGCLHYVFNIHRGRDKGKRKESRGAWPASSWHPCADAAVPDLRKDIPRNVIEDAIRALNALVEVRD